MKAEAKDDISKGLNKTWDQVSASAIKAAEKKVGKLSDLATSIAEKTAPSMEAVLLAEIDHIIEWENLPIAQKKAAIKSAVEEEVKAIHEKEIARNGKDKWKKYSRVGGASSGGGSGGSARKGSNVSGGSGRKGSRASGTGKGSKRKASRVSGSSKGSKGSKRKAGGSKRAEASLLSSSAPTSSGAPSATSYTSGGHAPPSSAAASPPAQRSILKRESQRLQFHEPTPSEYNESEALKKKALTEEPAEKRKARKRGMDEEFIPPSNSKVFKVVIGLGVLAAAIVATVTIIAPAVLDLLEEGTGTKPIDLAYDTLILGEFGDSTHRIQLFQGAKGENTLTSTGTALVSVTSPATIVDFVYDGSSDGTGNGIDTPAVIWIEFDGTNYSVLRKPVATPGATPDVILADTTNVLSALTVKGSAPSAVYVFDATADTVRNIALAAGFTEGAVVSTGLDLDDLYFVDNVDKLILKEASAGSYTFHRADPDGSNLELAFSAASPFSGDDGLGFEADGVSVGVGDSVDVYHTGQDGLGLYRTPALVDPALTEASGLGSLSTARVGEDTKAGTVHFNRGSSLLHVEIMASDESETEGIARVAPGAVADVNYRRFDPGDGLVRIRRSFATGPKGTFDVDI